MNRPASVAPGSHHHLQGTMDTETLERAAGLRGAGESRAAAPGASHPEARQPVHLGRLRARLSALSNRIRPGGWMVISLALALIIGVADVRSPTAMSFGVFYLVPVSLAAWQVGRWGSLVAAAITALTWCLGEYMVVQGQSGWIFWWNLFSRFGVFAFVALAAGRVRELQTGLQGLVRRRTKQLETETAHRIRIERELTAISHREQQRIGHSLHDSLGQHLAGIAFRAKALERSLGAKDLPESSEARELTGLVSDAIGQVRNLARVLDPIELEDNDLIAALQNLATEASKSLGCACTFQAQGEASALRAEKETALALYRISQEAIHNAATHGVATQVNIELDATPAGLRLFIRDNGQGFVTAPAPATGMGLHIMSYRANAIGASLDVRSSPGAGAEICCQVPAVEVSPPPNA